MPQRRWFSDASILQSIRSAGQLTPGITFNGKLLDGKKRAAACARLGIQFRTIEATSRTHALRMLWPLEPERALQICGEHLNAMQCAGILNADRAEVAEVLQRVRGATAPPQPKRVYSRRNTFKSRVPTQLHAYASAEMHAAVEACAQKLGISKSHFIRDALRDAIECTLTKREYARFSNCQTRRIDRERKL